MPLVFNLQIPASSSLAGLRFFTQFLSQDPSPLAAFRLSPQIDATLGF